MRYQFIEERREEYPVSVLCETLEVSVSRYYEWRNRPTRSHTQADIQLATHIRAAFHANRRV